MLSRDLLAPRLLLSVVNSFFAVILAMLSPIVLATTITLDIQDGAGEGFNDTTAATPVGGNYGATIGEQRLIVFEYAAAMIASIIDTPATIVIEAAFNPLSCSASSATLGQAGATSWTQNTCGVALSNTWTPFALVNAQNGQDPGCDGFFDSWPDEDLFPSSSDITITFNSEIDNNNSCLNNRDFYYGLDGNPGGDVDLLSTVLHEIIHGLGFQTLVDLASGSRPSNDNDVYMRNLRDLSINDNWGDVTMSNAERQASAIDDGDLVWSGSAVSANLGGVNNGLSGGFAQIYAPLTLAGGSSVSHFDTDLSPNELMEPFSTGPKESIGLAKYVLEDIGWTLFPNNAPILSPLVAQSLDSVQQLALEFAVIDNDTSLSTVSLSASSSDAAIIPQSGLAITGSGMDRVLNINPVDGTAGLVTITITADDGNTQSQSQFQVDVFSDFDPVLTINSPSDGALFYTSPQLFTANANDNEDGDITSDISWLSSLDGSFGTGGSVSPSLQDGNHLITASVIDSGSNNVSEVINVTVDLNGDADGDGLSNQLEVAVLGTDPEDSDSDNDLASDFDEVNRDGNPNNFTPGVDSDPNNPDTDGDGAADGADVDPLDPAVGFEVFVSLLPPWAIVAFASLLLSLGIAVARRRR